MRGHYGSAITHITSGLKILSELRANTSSASISGVSNLGRTSYIPTDVLCGLFTRLDMQAMVVRIPLQIFDPSRYNLLHPGNIF